MVARLLLLSLLFLKLPLAAVVVTVNAMAGQVLNWEDYAGLGPFDTLQIILGSPFSEVKIASTSIHIGTQIHCDGILRITATSGEIFHEGSVVAPHVIFEAPRIVLGKNSLTDVSGVDGQAYIGGGWHGEDPLIKNSLIVLVLEGATIQADSPGGASTVVFWSEKATGFQGSVLARGTGGSGDGGQVEISSHHYLFFDGSVDVSASGGTPGTLFFDPQSITVQSANPDINGNGGNLDMTSANQLDNAFTTPTGFPNAASVITAGAVASLLTNNVSMTLAAQNFITFNAALAPAGTNVTLTLAAPTVNLNAPITLAAGGILQGSGVTSVNVGGGGTPQNGVDVASSGATVHLAPGTYLGPINILNKNLTLQGSGAALTTILNPPGGVPIHSGRNPVIYVNGGTAVTIEALTVDGNYVGFPINANITGIFFENAGGEVLASHITKIANDPPPFMGGQQGNGIRSNVTAGGPFSLLVDGTTIDLFQKAGIVANGNLVVNLTNNTISGVGVPSTPAEIGIQLSTGAAGTISGNTISGLQFTDHAQSNGILLFSAGPGVVITGNTLSDNDEGILSLNAGDGLVITGNTVTNNGDTGIAILDTLGETTISSNTLTNNGGLAGPTGANAGIYIFSSANQIFNIEQNVITPAPGTLAIFSQGNGPGASPQSSLFENTFIDP